jgi:hypothetical protein
MEHANPMVNIQVLGNLGVRESARRLLTQALTNEVFKVHYNHDGMSVIEVIAGIWFTEQTVTALTNEMSAAGYMLYVESDYSGILVDYLDEDGRVGHFPSQVKCIVRINDLRHGCALTHQTVGKHKNLKIELISSKGIFYSNLVDYHELFTQPGNINSNCITYDADRGVEIRSFDKTAYAFTFATPTAAKIFYERITKLRNAK